MFATLYEFMKDKTIVVHDLRLMNECLESCYDKVEDDVSGSQTTNVFIAAFITCWTRLRLYGYLDHVGENALYFAQIPGSTNGNPVNPRSPWVIFSAK